MLLDDINKNRHRLIMQALKYAIDAEEAMFIYYKHLSSLIKNGRIKGKFHFFCDKVRTNKGLLTACIESFGIKNYSPENKNNCYKLHLDRFSLIGIINLGIEIVNTIMEFYKDLLVINNITENKKLFKKLLREKSEQINLLRKEKKFHEFQPF